MNPASNLFLIGAMGAGKSSLGRGLAARFGLSFVDLDSLIEQRTNTTVANIFAIEGEAGFRRRESALLVEAAAQDGTVLATGGGAVLAPENRTVLRTRGFVVWLQVGVDEQLARLARDRRRPLLAVPDRRPRLERLAAARDPIYRDLADLVIPASTGSCRSATERAATLIDRQWQRRARPAVSP